MGQWCTGISEPETTYTPTETADRTHTDALENGDHTPDHAQPTQDIRSQVHHWGDTQGQEEQSAAITQEEISVFKEPFSIRRVLQKQRQQADRHAPGS
ncbi:hypothetical protein Q0F98_14415 [Paenibacillus amylolyticus]|nr:hypothetical protein Q0F98_14415 [Paenibacillus amylolyticus]